MAAWTSDQIFAFYGNQVKGLQDIHALIDAFDSLPQVLSRSYFCLLGHIHEVIVA